MGRLLMLMSADPTFVPYISPSEVADRLEVMQRQESTTYRCKDYIGCKKVHRKQSGCTKGLQNRKRHRLIDRECRMQMCEWCYQVVDFCKFRREIVAIAMSYIDRFLSSSSLRAHKALYDRKDYQLAAMTALYIAIKIFEPMTMDAELVSAISHGCYSEEDIVEMEEEMLVALSWRLNGPTFQDFLTHIIALLPPSAYLNDSAIAKTLLEFSKFQVEIAVCDYDLALQKTSVVALAAIMNSAEGIDEGLFPARSRFHCFQLILDAAGMDPFSDEVNYARARLLELYVKNSGQQLPQIANLMPVVKADEETHTPMNPKETLRISSPVSVTISFIPGEIDLAKHSKS